MKFLYQLIATLVFLAIVLGTQQVMAQQGPMFGTQVFKPKLGFNPNCGIKEVPPPFPQLGFQKYSDKIYGYVRYCAVKRGDKVLVKIINEWTNGTTRTAYNLCSYHGWSGDNGTVFQVNHVGVSVKGGNGDKIIPNQKIITLEQFKSIRYWTWGFSYCGGATPTANPEPAAPPKANYTAVIRSYCKDAQGGSGSVDTTTSSSISCEDARSAAYSQINRVENFCRAQLSGSYTDVGVEEISTNTCP